MPLITVLFLSHSLIMHFTFVVSLNYFLTCVSYVELQPRLPRDQTTSSLWSVLCSFLCFSMPWDRSRTTHTLCPTYVDAETIVVPTLTSFSLPAGHLFPLCEMFQNWSKLDILSDGWKQSVYAWNQLPSSGRRQQFNSCLLFIGVKIVTWRFTVNRD